MNPVPKKLLFKGQDPVLVLGVPAEFDSIAGDLVATVHSSPGGQYMFVLAFVRSLAEADEAAGIVGPALADGAVFWLAYPKGTSRKYPKVDINRDIAHRRLGELGLEGVSMVAIDDDWSAMRFKRKV